MKTEIENIEIEIDEESKRISEDINCLDYFIEHKVKRDERIYLRVLSAYGSITKNLIDIIVNDYGYTFNNFSARNNKCSALFYKDIS